MRVKTAGKIFDRLWFLGTEASSVYLLEGRNESMLINGGLSCIVPDLLAQFEEFGIDESRITKILLLHSHFDHIGIAPYFKRRNPRLGFYASPRTSKILSKPSVIQAVNAASQYAIENCGNDKACTGLDLAWHTGYDFVSVKEGDRIDIGDLEVEIYETPGHSPCSVSAYLPGLKVLFPSDSGGLPFRNKIITYGTSDASKYEESLEKLQHLQTRYVCSDHYGYVCGDEAAGFIEASMAVARERREMVGATYRQTGDIEQTARQMAARFRDESEFNMVPYEVFVAAHRCIVEHIVGS